MNIVSQFDFDPSFESSLVVVDLNKVKLDSEDLLDEDLKKSFRDPPTVVKIQSGVNLCRFCSQMNHPRFSNCWIDPKTMSNIMNSFRGGQIYDANHLKEELRNKLAILDTWSKLGYRVKIELKKEVIAHIGFVGAQEILKEINDKVYFGKASTQLTKKSPLVQQVVERRKGGLVQIVIPRLKNKNLDQSENIYGKVTHFASI